MKNCGDTNINGPYVPDCPDCVATERLYQKERRYLNKAAGVATQLMCVAGLNWEKEVAIACNFTGNEADNMRRWDALHEKAAKKIRLLQESHAKLTAERDALRAACKAVIEAEDGSGSWNWAVDSCRAALAATPEAGEVKHEVA